MRTRTGTRNIAERRPFQKRRRHKPKIARLHRAGYTLGELARMVEVSFRFAQMWAAGTRRSPRLDARYKQLVSRSLAEKPGQNGRAA